MRQWRTVSATAPHHRLTCEGHLHDGKRPSRAFGKNIRQRFQHIIHHPVPVQVLGYPLKFSDTPGVVQGIIDFGPVQLEAGRGDVGESGLGVDDFIQQIADHVSGFDFDEKGLVIANKVVAKVVMHLVWEWEGGGG
jgi:hypothetical protein